MEGWKTVTAHIVANSIAAGIDEQKSWTQFPLTKVSN